MQASTRSATRANWAKIFAFAWSNSDSSDPNVLKELRADPKTTILELAEGTNGKYKKLLELLDSDTARSTVDAAVEIKDLTDNTPLEAYSGYLPIPRSPIDPSKLSKEDLTSLLGLGLDGILKFNVKAELWAEVLLAAWNDKSNSKLIAIRQNPLEGLKTVLTEAQVKELQDSTYGLLALPDRANGLDKLKIEELADFLGDAENAEHLGGIFLVAS